jgi:hypothetical protein
MSLYAKDLNSFDWIVDTGILVGWDMELERSIPSILKLEGGMVIVL